MKTRFIAIVLFTGWAQNALSSPITPQPLRKLVIESEYILHADVIDVKKVNPRVRRHGAKAILLIKEVLQGSMIEDTVEVFFRPSMICPGPASYEKGTTVLAFLDQLEQGYFTHALSYGSKTLDESAFNLYKKRIIEMQDIADIKDEEEKSAKTIDWLISCAMRPETRWEGVFDLSPQSDFISYYDPEKNMVVHNHELTDNHKSELMDVLLNIESLTYKDFILVDLVAEDHEEEVLQFLVRKLKETETKSSWFRRLFIERITELSGKASLKRLVKQMGKLHYTDENYEEKVANLQAQFMERM
ncbi:MAG: hypothetical protein KI790_08845 [Cyclobacteriaceae bacterium]|nr:hypothetical protein [Cyclobacteriaceae bacterium HetDA_MAG_MS6]